MLLEIYHAKQQIFLPYPLPFGQAHCVCCRWSYSFSSAYANLPFYSARVATYFTVSDSYNPPPIAASDTKSIFLDAHTTGSLQSSAFVLQPEKTSIWCGAFTNDGSEVLQYIQSLSLPSGHVDFVQCKFAPVNIYLQELMLLL
jgi:hypothetical protein